MSETRYTKSHEWVRLDGGIATVGITDHAQHALGDIVFAETPEAGRVMAAGDACAVVESVKAASDVYSPVAGTVVAGNPALTDAPEKINTDPYGEGWLWQLTPADPAAVDALAPRALVCLRRGEERGWQTRPRRARPRRRRSTRPGGSAAPLWSLSCVPPPGHPLPPRLFLPASRPSLLQCTCARAHVHQ